MYKIVKKCLYCKKEFISYICKKSKFCSKKCQSQGLKKIMKGRPATTSSFKKGHISFNKGRFGKNSFAWKGGKAKHTKGYIWIYKPEHPFCNHKKYVLEHRLIMEKHLKRYLTPQERIHHKNGVTSDNRLINLKLFPNNSKHMKSHHRLPHDKLGRFTSHF